MFQRLQDENEILSRLNYYSTIPVSYH